MVQPVSFRGIFVHKDSFGETESIAVKRAKESFTTVVSFWINESPMGAIVESEPFCAKETPAEIKKINTNKINRFK